MPVSSASPLAKVIGANIRQARDAAGLTQAQLAERLGVGHATRISAWENGTHRPSDKHMDALVAEFAHELVWFFTDHSEAAAA